MTRDLTVHTMLANWVTPDACRYDVTCDPWITHAAFFRTLQHRDEIGIMILLLDVSELEDVNTAYWFKFLTQKTVLRNQSFFFFARYFNEC